MRAFLCFTWGVPESLALTRVHTDSLCHCRVFPSALSGTPHPCCLTFPSHPGLITGRVMPMSWSSCCRNDSPRHGRRAPSPSGTCTSRHVTNALRKSSDKQEQTEKTEATETTWHQALKMLITCGIQRFLQCTHVRSMADIDSSLNKGAGTRVHQHILGITGSTGLPAGLCNTFW